MYAQIINSANVYYKLLLENLLLKNLDIWKNFLSFFGFFSVGHQLFLREVKPFTFVCIPYCYKILIHFLLSLCFLYLGNIGLPLSLSVWINNWGVFVNGRETDTLCSLFFLLKGKDGILQLVMSLFHCSCTWHK